MPAKPVKPSADPWKNRIVEMTTMTAEELQAHPKNPRLHTTVQRKALNAVMDDLGWVAPIVVNRLTGRIVDGHMRVEEAAQRGPIPVALVELSEEEEAKALALMDPIGALATVDTDVLASLTDGLALDEDLNVVLGIAPAPVDDEKPEPRREPKHVQLAPLTRAFVMVSIPLDEWDMIAPILDQLEAAGAEVTTRTT